MWYIKLKIREPDPSQVYYIHIHSCRFFAQLFSISPIYRNIASPTLTNHIIYSKIQKFNSVFLLISTSKYIFVFCKIIHKFPVYYSFIFCLSFCILWINNSADSISSQRFCLKCSMSCMSEWGHRRRWACVLVIDATHHSFESHTKTNSLLKVKFSKLS